MGRFSGNSSYNHRIDNSGPDYLISWVVDRYYPSSRLRQPRMFHRYTDLKGAQRFAKKWDVPMPEESK